MAKMKAFISSCSSSEGGTSTSSSSSASFSNANNNIKSKNLSAGFKASSWIRSCSLSSSKKSNQPFSLNRAMKKARLSDFCCTGASSAGDYYYSGEESRAMMNVSPSPNHHSSTCSSSGSTCNPTMNLAPEAPASREWMEIKDLHDSSAAAPGSSTRSKRVVVVVDESREAKTALLWALSHVVSKSDVVTLLYILQGNAALYYSVQDSRAIIPDRTRLRCEEKGCELITSLKALCSLRQPEADVEVVVIAGEKSDRGPAIVRQAKKLDASILILGHKKLNFLQRCLRWNREDQLADYCIQHAECLTLSVRPKNKQCGGYLINSKWQRNFWLLA